MKKTAKKSDAVLQPLDAKSRKTLVISLILVLAALAIYQIGKLEKLKDFATYPNQACVGIGMAVKNDVPLNHYDFAATTTTDIVPNNAVGQHHCNIGTVITEEKTNDDGSGFKSGYTLGADVIYFKDASTAYSFAEEGVNKMHYWSVNDQDAKNGIRQTSLFTFLETSVDEPYFDAYTVRDKAVIRISLPCDMTIDQEKNKAFDACQKTAQTVLKAFADKVQVNLAKQPIQS